MADTKIRFGRFALFVHEILFSLNCTWLILRHDLYTLPASSVLLGALVGHTPYGYFHRYLYWRLGHFYVNFADCIALSLISGVTLFLILRPLARFSLTRALLRTLAGLVAVVGFPLTCLYWPPFLQTVHARGLLEIEVVLATACAALYLYRKWPVTPAITLGLLVVHVGLWSWATDSYAGWKWSVLIFYSHGSALLAESALLIYTISYPVLGLFSSLAWGIYINAEVNNRYGQGHQRPVSPVLASNQRLSAPL